MILKNISEVMSKNLVRVLYDSDNFEAVNKLQSKRIEPSTMDL
jgi:hypothetical protein